MAARRNSRGGDDSNGRLEPMKHLPSLAEDGNDIGTTQLHQSEQLLATRNRRSSQDEIRALLDRTNKALDKIVRIRESMEPFVDFSQFEATKQSSGSLSSSSGAPRPKPRLPPRRMSSEPAELASRNTASSYGSTEASSISEDARLTNSTHSSTSSQEDTNENHTSSRSREPQEDPHTSSRSSEDNADGEEDDQFDEDPNGSQTSSSISTVEEMSPLKEARLERLKNIEISFHEGLPKEFFQALCRFLYSNIEVKTRHSRFNFYKDTFTGSDAVREMIVTGFAEDQPVALRYGNVLVRLGFIEHVSRTDDQLHNTKDNFYRFTKVLEYDDNDFAPDSQAARMSINAANYRESVLSRDSSTNIEYDFSTASDEVHALVTEETLQILARMLHKVFERKNKLLFYKGFVGCFLGAEAVNVIRELRIGTSLIDAVLVGQALLDEGLIEPIATSVSTFQDKYIFYRLTKVRG